VGPLTRPQRSGTLDCETSAWSRFQAANPSTSITACPQPRCCLNRRCCPALSAAAPQGRPRLRRGQAGWSVCWSPSAGPPVGPRRAPLHTPTAGDPGCAAGGGIVAGSVPRGDAPMGGRGGGGSCQASCQHPVTHSPGGRPLDCGKFSARGGQGQRQSLGSDPAVQPPSAGVTAGLGMPARRAGAGALRRGCCTSSSSKAHASGGPCSLPRSLASFSAWAKPSAEVRPLQPMCRVSECEHRVCGAPARSREVQAAVPSCLGVKGLLERGRQPGDLCREFVPVRRAARSLQAVSIPASTPHRCHWPAPAPRAVLTRPRQQPLPCAWQWGGTTGHRGRLSAASAPSRDPLPPMEAPN